MCYCGNRWVERIFWLQDNNKYLYEFYSCLYQFFPVLCTLQLILQLLSSHLIVILLYTENVLICSFLVLS